MLEELDDESTSEASPTSPEDEKIAALQDRIEELRGLLSEQQQAFHALIDASPLGVAIINTSGVIETASTMLEKQFEYNPGEMVGLALSELIPERFREVHGQQVSEFISHTRVRMMGIGLDLYGKRKDGSEFPVEIGLGFVTLAGEPKVAAFTADITVRRQSEVQTRALLVEHERTRLLQSFVQDLAHDFRTPLAIVLSAAYLIRRYSSSEKIDTYAQQIDSQAKQINSLVDNLLKLTQLENANVASILISSLDLNEVVRDVAAELSYMAQTRNIQISLDLDADLPHFTADRDEIKRALMNLIDNAIKYTLSDGVVAISTYLDHEQIVVSIKDTGIGVPAESLELIFERFFRTEGSRQLYPNGVGLGLPIARRIIDMHQGTINVESTIGHGSTFNIRLPLSWQKSFPA